MESSYSPDQDGAAAELEALGFSLEEAHRLARYRVQASSHGEHAERQANERRLQFARWLVETGHIKQ